MEESQGQEYPRNYKRNKTKWAGNILRRNCFLKRVIDGMIKAKIKGQEDEEDDVSSYWMILRKRGETGH